MAPTFQASHQDLRFIGPSLCGLVDLVMQCGGLQSQRAGHSRWWRRAGLRFSYPEVVHSLSGSIQATSVVGKRQFVVLFSGQITSCAFHIRLCLPWPLWEGPSGSLFLLSGIGNRPSSVHTMLCYALLCGPMPREANRSPSVDDIFDSLLTILRHHAPSQRQHPRRRQPAWWTSECFEACVARNGAWRDFRRTQDPRDCSRFCAARTHVHRTVRSCQNSFWSQWQDRVANLSRVNPRAAASAVLHTFRQGQSRRDQTHCVRWPQGQDPLEQWRQHFMSVGVRSSSQFDSSFHAEITRRFADLPALPPVAGFLTVLSQRRSFEAPCLDASSPRLALMDSPILFSR